MLSLPIHLRRASALVPGACLLAFLASTIGYAGCGEEFRTCNVDNPCGNPTSPAGGAASGGTSSSSGAGGEAESSSGASSIAEGGAAELPGGSHKGGFAGEPGDGQAGEGGGGEPPCDSARSPSEETCLVSNSHSVFVAPTGSDDAAGTREAPFKTLGKGVQIAEARGKLVVVCNGSFDEHLDISSGVRVHGGFACPTEAEPWIYQRGTRTKLAPYTEGPVLNVEAGPQEVVLEDLEFRSADATGRKMSSIAATVRDSSALTLRRVRIIAGRAANGAHGEKGTDGEDAPSFTDAQIGKDAACGPAAPELQYGGRWPADSTCGSRAGAGGIAYKSGVGKPGAGAHGLPLTGVNPANFENGGRAEQYESDSWYELRGQPGSAGNSGTPGAVNPKDGTFTPSDYLPAAPGGSGADGFPGQGGGGGGGSAGTGSCVGASGGAGGMGGCGGKGGSGGAGGGASIALLSFDSSVRLEACELAAGNGGDGGNGGNGGAGGDGGSGITGGNPISDGADRVGAGGPGGDGGDGGAGGPGAGGNGGPSYAVAYRGEAPRSLSDTSYLAGRGGRAGRGGTAASIAAPSGAEGLSLAQIALPTR